MNDLIYLSGISSEYWDDYRYGITPATPVVLKPGEQKSLLPSAFHNVRGLLLSYSLISSSPSLIFEVSLDNNKLTANISDMYEAGYTFYVPSTPFLYTYDTTNNVYSIGFQGEVIFRNNFYAIAKNPSTSTENITIELFDIHAFLFNDGFYKELNKIKNLS